MTAPLNYCPGGGVLVAAAGRIPQDPSEFSPWRLLLGSGIGCNRLRCTLCEAEVRQVPRLASENGGIQLARALYDADDWSAVPGVIPSMGRLYACRCHVFSASHQQTVANPDPDPGDPVPPPWDCQGHPIASLPVDVDGVTIDDTTDVRGLVWRAFAGWMPDDTPAVDFYENWVARLYERLRGLPLADALSRAVAACLDTADPPLVGSALVFFNRYPDAAGSEQVAAFAADPNRPRRLWPALMAEEDPFWVRVSDVMAGRAHADPAAREALRLMVLDPTEKVVLQTPLAMSEWDAEWLADQAAEIARAHPRAWTGVMEGLAGRRPDLAVQAALSIARSGAVDGPTFNRWLDDQGMVRWAKRLREALA